MVLCPVDMSHVPPSLYVIIFSVFVQWHIFHKKISGQKETLFVLGNLVFTGKSCVKETQSFFSSGRFLGKLKWLGCACQWSTAPPVPQFKPTTTNLHCRLLVCNCIQMIYLVHTDLTIIRHISNQHTTNAKCTEMCQHVKHWGANGLGVKLCHITQNVWLPEKKVEVSKVSNWKHKSENANEHNTT